MTFNTALGLLLVALACCIPDGRVKACYPIRLGMVVIVGSLVALSLAEDLFGLHLGIDNLLGADT